MEALLIMVKEINTNFKKALIISLKLIQYTLFNLNNLKWHQIWRRTHNQIFRTQNTKFKTWT